MIIFKLVREIFSRSLFPFFQVVIRCACREGRLLFNEGQQLALSVMEYFQVRLDSVTELLGLRFNPLTPRSD